MLLKTLTLLITIMTVILASAADDETNANVTQAELEHLRKRTSVAGVYVCDEYDWGGDCGWSVASGGACHNRAFINRGSFGPDHGLTCKLFMDSNCKCPYNACGGPPTGPVQLTYPGMWTGQQFQQWFVDKGYYEDWQSYQCHWT